MLTKSISSDELHLTERSPLDSPRRIMLTPETLRSLVSLASHASTEPITPVITAVLLHFDPSARLIQGFATDRYRAAWFEQTDVDFATGESDTFTVLAPAKFLVAVGRALGAKKHVLGESTPAIVIEWTRDRLTVSDSILGFSLSTTPEYGNYPPIARLFPDENTLKPFDGGVRLKTSYLAALDKLRVPGQDRETCVTVFTAAGTEYSPNKPSPILAVLEGRIPNGGMAETRVIIQPNLIIR